MTSDFFKEDSYWKNHVHRTLEEDFWIDEYRDVLPANGRALDLGCGIGQYTRRLSEYGLTVTSADISDIALREVEAFHPDCVKLDMREPLPFSDHTFDLVFANLSIHYFSDAHTKALIDEVRRILVPGGMFVGSVNSIHGGLEAIRDTAEELEHHFYWNRDRHIRLFDKEDLTYYLSDFSACRVEARETVRFGNHKNYLIFICK